DLSLHGQGPRAHPQQRVGELRRGHRAGGAEAPADPGVRGGGGVAGAAGVAGAGGVRPAGRALQAVPRAHAPDAVPGRPVRRRAARPRDVGGGGRGRPAAALAAGAAD
ncbi:MAG: hypothetical protein AVDCRST_MAG64-1540, partial [uncultured Phycisphaerae bacterium]